MSLISTATSVDFSFTGQFFRSYYKQQQSTHSTTIYA